jgi:hypothetical protein
LILPASLIQNHSFTRLTVLLLIVHGEQVEAAGLTTRQTNAEAV